MSNSVPESILGSSAATSSCSPGYRPIYSWQALQRAMTEPIITPGIVIDIMRHGESVTNSQNLITGRSDVDLTPGGKHQAKVVALQLDSYYDIAWCSALRRSIETLRIALETSHTVVEQIISDCRLDERSLGVLEYQKQRTIEAYARGDLTYAPQNGESYVELAQRCLSFLLDLVICARQRNKAMQVLVSTHVGPMRIISGIVKQETDPTKVLAENFSNTQVARLNLNQLAWPPFLERSILPWSERD